MQILFLLPEYLVWHYSKALRLHVNIVTNFMWFTYHFFSIPVLLRTFTKSWHSKTLHAKPVTSRVKRFADHIIARGLLAVGGPLMRLLVLVFGFACCGFVAVIGLGFFLLWLALPIIVLVLVFEAFRILIP